MKTKYNSPDFEIIKLSIGRDVLSPSDEVIATEGYIEPRPGADDFD